MSVLSVQQLRKAYASFTLEPLSFSLNPGRITGFIGRNGAGKTTALKCMLGLAVPDGGSVHFWNRPFHGNEPEIKSRIGYVSGGVDFYARKKLRDISAVTRRFYANWDEAAYQRYLRLFALEERKTPAELSAGMKVKYALTLALSHRAELLILDEPTSGLDPVSRSEILDIFLELKQQGTTILFSTHITSDLEQCADHILYLKNGVLAADCALTDFAAAYRLVTFTERQRELLPEDLLIGCKRNRQGYSALIRSEARNRLPFPSEPADLETIMVHLEKSL